MLEEGDVDVGKETEGCDKTGERVKEVNKRKEGRGEKDGESGRSIGRREGRERGVRQNGRK